MSGKLIVLEGIDGSGTTTQANRVQAALFGLHVAIHVTEEPSQGPVGSIIRQILHGRLVSTGFGGMSAPSWSVMALLFAADRIDHLESEILPNLSDGVNVISDRYLHSSLAYQTATSGDEANLDWVRAVNRFARTPDLIFFFDVDPQEAQRRRLSRRIGQELYDDLPLQARIAEQYRKLFRGPQDCRVVTVDANAPVDDVTRVLLGEIKPLLKV